MSSRQLLYCASKKSRQEIHNFCLKIKKREQKTKKWEPQGNNVQFRTLSISFRIVVYLYKALRKTEICEGKKVI